MIPKWDGNYYGKTKRHFNVRMCVHLGMFAFIRKRFKEDNDSAIKKCLLWCNHAPDFEDFSLLTTNSNDFTVKLMESLLISRGHLHLNNNNPFLPLEIFHTKVTKFHHMISREIDSICWSSFFYHISFIFSWF